jgi:hypothetical protein
MFFEQAKKWDRMMKSGGEPFTVIMSVPDVNQL